MNGSNEKDMLARELRDRAERMTGHPLDLDSVKGRARGIQRRRRVTTGLVAAVVLGIAVPVGLGVADNMQSTSPAPFVGRTPSPSPSADPTPTPEAPRGPIPASGATAPRGDDAGVTYLAGSVVHPAGQSPSDLGRRYDGIAPYDSGWITYDWATGMTYQLDGDGAVQWKNEGVGLAIGSDGIDVSYPTRTADGNYALALESTDGSRKMPVLTIALPAGTVIPVGFAGDDEVVYRIDRAKGSGVYVTDFSDPPVRIDGLITANGANDVTGTVAGVTSVDDLEQSSCSVVMDVASQRALWETCDYTLTQFSPDGRYVLGIDAYGDGLGGSSAAILDASDGTVLADYTTRDLGFTHQVVWETDSTALLTTHQDGAWYMLRLAPDGSIEQALDPVDGSPENAPWAFGARP